MILTGKTAVVTGGRRGIGLACALALRDAGAQLIVIAKSRDRGTLSAEFSYISADLSDPAQRAGLLTDHIDILINNAGVSYLRPALELTPTQWQETIELNLTAVFDLSCQAMRCGATRIINMASTASFSGARNVSAYTATKHALIGLTKCLSTEWSGRGVTVNNVAPGIIDTDMNQALRDDPIHLQQLLGRVPTGRIGTPDDVVGAVMFLVSPAAQYITGTTVVVDGGWLGR